MVGPYGSQFLWLCYLFCHLLRFSTSVSAVLCSLLGFPCLRVGTLLACSVSGASSLQSLQSRLPFVVGPPSHSVCPSPALAVGWFGHRSVAPPAAPVCWAIVGSFVLGVISFWLGFGLCLGILLAPCGCWRTCCGPHCGRESVRVLASLLGSYPSGVRHLSRVLFLSLGPCRSRSPIPSLAPSWWSPCPLMRGAFL